MSHIVIVCQHNNKFAYIAHFPSVGKKKSTGKKGHEALVQKQSFAIESILNQIKYSFNRYKLSL